MTLQYQLRREDVLALTRKYYESSPTYRKSRMRVRFLLPIIMLALWTFTTKASDSSYFDHLVFPTVALLWFFFYPPYFDRRVIRAAARYLDESSHDKTLGPCELTLTTDGLHAKSPSGQSSYLWSAVHNIEMTSTYLFIFLNGAKGFPIPIADVGTQAATAARDFILHQTQSTRTVTAGC